MALVMLPCELPWWPQVQRQLSQLQDGTKNTVESLVRVLTSIHTLCNVSLDPDESETVDLEQFSGLATFLNTECDETERQQVLSCAVPSMVQYALRLRELKPPGGLHFSLQQQADCVALDKRLAAALLAHAFFSSFPKRSLKTHPTLLDFNFSYFFKHLHLPSQQAKFRSIMQYYCLLSKSEPSGCVKISRKVLSSVRWLTVEDWLESCRPLCPVLVRHQPRPECAPEPAAVILAPCSAHIGNGVLAEDFTPECRLLAAQPETLAILLFVEALEDNEALLLEGASQSARINPLPSHYEALGTNAWASTSAQLLSFADPEDFAALPYRQYEEDNILRELNKLFLAFEPSSVSQPSKPPSSATLSSKRLSPIGESFSSTPPETCAASPITMSQNKNLLRISSLDRAGRFIALGSSGELLPISRNDLPSNHPRLCGPRHSLLGIQPTTTVTVMVPPVSSQRHRGLSSERFKKSSSHGDSSDDEDDEFHSAKESLDLSEDGAWQNGHELDTAQRRCSFAQRLREALRREACALGAVDSAGKEKFTSSSSSSSSSERDGSSYAVGISVSGSDVGDRNFKVRRGGSCGFALPEDQELVLGQNENDPLGLAPAKWLGRALSKDSDSNDDSNISQHNSEYSSDLEELYEHFSRWLEHDKDGEEEAQEDAIRSFARGLLTRTLSDCGLLKTTKLTSKGTPGVTRSLSEAAGSTQSRSNAPRRLAVHLASLLGDGRAGPRPVATGSWWGGHTFTDPQLKAVLQWLAASQAQSSCLLYYTEGISALAKLDTVCRVIVDRQWSVGELTSAVLRFAQSSLEFADPNSFDPNYKRSLFDELIGTEKPVVTLETEL